MVATTAAIALSALMVSGCTVSDTSEPTGAPSGAADETFDLNEATIAEITAALESGTITSVELTARYLNRLAKFDLAGTRLNSTPVLNPNALADAAEADRLRAEGTILGPLHGIPLTVKDSYKVEGLTVAAGSPAFENLVADADAYNVEALRAAGGIVLGKTNMPPLANSGLPRGVYGRAESPYNQDYLSAAWNSGSSNGSGVATASNFAAFGMGEETVSSGRSPASNNGLVAYTPSRGIISIRGNWPLAPTMDVVVPHTRTVEDLMTVMDVVAHEDPNPEGDFWLEQPYIEIPSVEDIRPESFHDLKDEGALDGVRVGVPRMYINQDEEGEQPTVTRDSIIDLWERTATELEELGAEVVPVDFPLVENSNEDRPGAENMYTRGMAPEEWGSIQWGPLGAYWMEDFLQSNEDPNYPTWMNVDPEWVFPNPTYLEREPEGFEPGSYQYILDALAERTVEDPFDLEPMEGGLLGMEQFREQFFDDWMDENELDMLAFPANADVGEANADVNIEANERATALGVARSNTASVMRTYGLPSMSVPMGLAEDIKMPVNVTFMGKQYSDNDLISYAYAYEQATHHRTTPPRAPALPSDAVELVTDPELQPEMRDDVTPPTLVVDAQQVDFGQPVPRIEAIITAEDASGIDSVELTANGDEITLVEREDGSYLATIFLDRYLQPGDTGPVDTVYLLALTSDGSGNAAAQFTPVSLAGALQP